MSRSTAISRDRPRPSNGRREIDRSVLLRENSAPKESHPLLKRDHASCGRMLAQVEAEKAELVAAYAAEKIELVAAYAIEKAAMVEDNRQSRELTAALKQRVGELERSANPFVCGNFATILPKPELNRNCSGHRGTSFLASGTALAPKFKQKQFE